MTRKRILRTLRFSWLLFEDINTRFNILQDECGHLQDTIFGYLNAPDSEYYNKESRRHPGERQWFEEQLRTKSYYALPPTERALLNLWSTLGSLAYALEEGQTHVRKRFEACVEVLGRLVQSHRIKENAEASEDDQNTELPSCPELYWFVSLRGAFVHDSFRRYLLQIQHAHEKLVHIIENMPGILPGPTLLRRWSCGAYGDLLSAYSRHVNWRTQHFLWRYVYQVRIPPAPNRDEQSDRGSDNAFWQWRDQQFLTHAWSHVPSSRTTQHFVHTESDSDVAASRDVLAFATVWSAYFYLEQPILLPLLYHECAHHYISSDALPEKIGGSDYTPATNRFLSRKRETIYVLTQMAQFRSHTRRFWEQFVEEVWTDVVSIHLGGQGYLAALALQLFGRSGEHAFSMFEPDKDRLVPLDEIGATSREVRGISWPLHDESYVWEARLQIALKSYARLHDDKSEWCAAIEDLLATWYKSGAHVFQSSLTSSEHAAYWQYRENLNQWVVDTCISALDDCYAEFRQPTVGSSQDHLFALDKEIQTLIRSAIQTHRTNFFGDLAELVSTDKLSLERLENVCIESRWLLSADIVHKLVNRPATELANVRDFTDSYANYIQSDGSTAFRLAYEWIQARTELHYAVADVIRDSTLCNALMPKSGILARLREAAEGDIGAHLDSSKARHQSAECTAARLADQLSAKGHSAEEDFENIGFAAPTRVRAEIKKILNKNVASQLRNCTLAHTDVRIGTLTLGALRCVSAEPAVDAQSPLCVSISAIENHFVALVALLNKRTKPLGAINSDKFAGEFVPLVGDYSFLHYLTAHTPVERDCRPPNTPKMVIKPRLVMQVYGDYHGIGVNARSASGSMRELIGRVCQARFRYRWQWIDLVCSLQEYERDQEKADTGCPGPTLFLSSGWEDAFLIFWHRNEEEWIAISERFQLQTARGVDSHTNIGIIANSHSKERDSPQTSPYLALETLDAVLQEHPYVHTYNRRTGRYDVTVVWRKPVEAGWTELPLIEFWGVLQELPAAFWSEVGNITNSFEISQKPDCSVTHEIVSHILLRH